MSDKEKDSDWVAVSTQMHEWVAQIHRDHLLSEGIDAVIMNKRDSSYTLNLGKGGYVYVMVNKENQVAAERILTDVKVSLEDESLSIADDSELDSEIEIDQKPDLTRPEGGEDIA